MKIDHLNYFNFNQSVNHIYISKFSFHPLLEFIFAKNLSSLISGTTKMIQENSVSIYLFKFIIYLRNNCSCAHFNVLSLTHGQFNWLGMWCVWVLKRWLLKTEMIVVIVTWSSCKVNYCLGIDWLPKWKQFLI